MFFYGKGGQSWLGFPTPIRLLIKLHHLAGIKAFVIFGLFLVVLIFCSGYKIPHLNSKCIMFWHITFEEITWENKRKKQYLRKITSLQQNCSIHCGVHIHIFMFCIIKFLLKSIVFDSLWKRIYEYVPLQLTIFCCHWLKYITDGAKKKNIACPLSQIESTLNTYINLIGEYINKCQQMRICIKRRTR